MTIPAQVVDVGSRMGIKGVSRIRCKILDGRDRDKIVVRNVSGPIKKGDIIMLKETSMEAESGFSRR